MIPAAQAENGEHIREQRGGLFDSPYSWITLAFGVSRILYFWAGIQFDTQILASNFQFIDLELLKTRLFESLYYFHMQPPLQNLLVGTANKAFPDNYGVALHALYLAAGLSAAMFLFVVMRRLGVSEPISLALTIIFVTSPACILYENFPMYEYLIMWLLLASSLALYNLFQRPTFWRAFMFFSLLATLAWLRSLYHLFYLVGIAAVLVFALRKNRMTIILAAVVPIGSVLALYLKNLLLFGLFSSSSWLGHALVTCTIHQLTEAEKNNLIEQGKLAEIARVESGVPVAEYRPFFPRVGPTGIPVLDEEVKSTGGLNTNNILYLKADFAYRKAAQQVLRNYPVAYARSVAIAWFCYFLPPSDFFQFEEARAHIQRLNRFYNVVFFGQFREATGKQLRVLRSEGHTISLVLYTGIFLIIGFAVLLPAGLTYLIQGTRRRFLAPAQAALLIFVILNITYIVATTNFLSSFENNRYAFPSGPLYVSLIGLCLQVGMAFFRGKRQRSVE